MISSCRHFWRKYLTIKRTDFFTIVATKSKPCQVTRNTEYMFYRIELRRVTGCGFKPQLALSVSYIHKKTYFVATSSHALHSFEDVHKNLSWLTKHFVHTGKYLKRTFLSNVKNDRFLTLEFLIIIANIKISYFGRSRFLICLFDSNN